MRTPNTQCLLCEKPLYRRPSDMAKARYAACMACRSQAQKVAGITDRQKAGLRLGSVKGTNHRTGYKHRESSKLKISKAHKKFHRDNPDKAMERGAKMRGENHYRWNGGINKLNTSIRQMTENRRWMDAIKERDGRCVRCKSTDDLESHHKTGLAKIIQGHGITSRADARSKASILWNLDNGITLCRPCHYEEHGRVSHAD